MPASELFPIFTLYFPPADPLDVSYTVATVNVAGSATRTFHETVSPGLLHCWTYALAFLPGPNLIVLPLSSPSNTRSTFGCFVESRRFESTGRSLVSYEHSTTTTLSALSGASVGTSIA